MADEQDRVRGMGEAAKMAQAGLKLFKEEDAAVLDVDGATKFKEEMDAKMAVLDTEAAALTGKDNKKPRAEKGKEVAAIKAQKDYIDACKVVKGLPPVNGFFCQKAEEAAALAGREAGDAAEADDTKAKKEKPKKAQESAGISRAEKDELESLKNKIIEKKKALKEGGMSGGQMNKDEDIVSWVNRMNELKEKENPGSLAAAKDEKKSGGKKGKKLDSETQAALDEKERTYEEYMEKLRTEFKYTKKEIAADPDALDMKTEIDKMKKGS